MFDPILRFANEINHFLASKGWSVPVRIDSKGKEIIIGWNFKSLAAQHFFTITFSSIESNPDQAFKLFLVEINSLYKKCENLVLQEKAIAKVRKIIGGDN